MVSKDQEGKKRKERIFLKLVLGLELPISKKFMSQETNLRKKGLLQHRSTDEYSLGIYRVPVPLKKVSAFGSRLISPAHRDIFKNAVDFYVPTGTEVTAPAGGTVCELIEGFEGHGISTRYWFRGNGITLACPNGEYVWLEHMQHRFATRLGLKLGQKVRAGSVIGISDNTGFSEHPHVHIEVLKFTGKRKTKAALADYRNYLSKRIRFNRRDIPFDLYREEDRGR